MSWIDRVTSRLSGRKRESATYAQTGLSSVVHAIPRESPPGAAKNGVSAFPRFQSSATDQLSPRLSDRFANARLKLSNAFTPSQPVLDRRLFAGRNDVLTTLIRSLEDQRLHIVLYGDRGIGKTSLLHVLTQAAREARYIVIYCSCGASSSFDETFRAIAEDIPLLFHSGFSPTATATEQGSSFADLLPTTSLSPRIVGDMFAKLVGTRVLVILDEFDRTESNEFRRNIAELIKNLSDRSVRVQLVIAGVASDLAELVEHTPSMRRNLFALQVPKMSPPESRQLVTNGEAASGLKFEPEAIEFVVFVAHGSPYIASLLSHHAGVAAVDRSRMTVGVEDVSVAVNQALAEFKGRISKQYLIQIDQTTNEGYQQMLGALGGAALFSAARFDNSDIDTLYAAPESAARCRAILDDLADKGLLMERFEGVEGPGYRFFEEAIPPYLWMQLAQKRFGDRRKPGAAAALTDKGATATAN